MSKVIVTRLTTEHGSTIEDALIGKLGKRGYAELREGMKRQIPKPRSRRRA